MYAGKTRRWAEARYSTPRRGSNHLAKDRRVDEVDPHDFPLAREVITVREVDAVASTRSRAVERQCELGRSPRTNSSVSDMTNDSPNARRLMGKA